MLSTSSHEGEGGSREAVYISLAALNASTVVCVEVAVFTYWTAMLSSRRARGHDSAHVAKRLPTRSALRLLAPLKCRNALDNEEVSAPVEDGARGEVEGRLIAKKYEISRWFRDDHGTMHYGQYQACTAEEYRKWHFLVHIILF